MTENLYGHVQTRCLQLCHSLQCRTPASKPHPSTTNIILLFLHLKTALLHIHGKNLISGLLVAYLTSHKYTTVIQEDKAAFA